MSSDMQHIFMQDFLESFMMEAEFLTPRGELIWRKILMRAMARASELKVRIDSGSGGWGHGYIARVISC